MTSLASVTIDAGVLAAPEIDCSRDEAHRYLESLRDWGSLLDEPWVDLRISERASQVLLADGMYPMFDRLRKLFDRHGMDAYGVQDFVRFTNDLLMRVPSFEERFQVDDILLERMETEPSIVEFPASEDVPSDLARCIALIAVLRRYCAQPLGGHVLGLRNAPARLVAVSAEVADIEHRRNDIKAHTATTPRGPMTRWRKKDTA